MKFFKLMKKLLFLPIIISFMTINFIQINKGFTMEYKKTIAIDLDGVLNEYNGKYDEHNIPNIKAGAKEFIIELSKDYKLILFTTRDNKKVKDWLIKNDIDKYFDNITNTKPLASIYLDDRALKFEGDFGKTINDIKNYRVYWKY